MIRKRIRKLFAVAATAAWLTGVGVTLAPMAQADPLDAIRAAVNGNRASTPCDAYKYSGFLEGAAQKYARSEAPLDSQAAGYAGQSIGFLGSGDPQAAATTSAYERGAGPMISNCDFTEFGVGFIRHEDREVDVVTIIFGKPNKPVEAPAAGQVDTPAPPKKCPEGSVAAQVPATENCAPPTNAVTLSVTQAGINAKVAVTNKSALPADCTYTATKQGGVGPATVTENVSVGPNDTEDITGLLWPPVFPPTSYSATAKCTATYDGKQVTIGETAPQTVP